MSRDILIAGENGEIYHITEKELQASHRVSPAAAAKAQGLFRAVGQDAATVTPGQLGDWTGGVSQCKSDEIRLLKLGVTHDDESS